MYLLNRVNEIIIRDFVAMLIFDMKYCTQQNTKTKNTNWINIYNNNKF